MMYANMQGRDEKCMQNCSEKSLKEEANHLRDLDVKMRITLKAPRIKEM